MADAVEKNDDPVEGEEGAKEDEKWVLYHVVKDKIFILYAGLNKKIHIKPIFVLCRPKTAEELVKESIIAAVTKVFFWWNPLTFLLEECHKSLLFNHSGL